MPTFDDLEHLLRDVVHAVFDHDERRIDGYVWDLVFHAQLEPAEYCIIVNRSVVSAGQLGATQRSGKSLKMLQWNWQKI